MQITNESLQKTSFRRRMHRHRQTRILQHRQRNEILVAQERERERNRRFDQGTLLHRARDRIVEIILVEIIRGRLRRQ